MHSVGGLFSGIGAIEMDFEKARCKILWSNENNEQNYYVIAISPCKKGEKKLRSFGVWGGDTTTE